MSESVLRFTFSPVQSFIAEARRTADLFAGSRILAELAAAAAQSIADSGGNLVFPASLSGHRHDAPNVVVALVPWERAKEIAQDAQRALSRRWEELVGEARHTLSGLEPVDQLWEETWQRQTAQLWDVYWSAARLDGSYGQAFRRAGQGLAATKRLRAFGPAEEPGLKDSLSGNRAALRTRALDAPAYWKRVRRARHALGAVGEHERLDAVGAVKRFARLAQEETFPSLPTVAARPFLDRAEERAQSELAAYARTLEELFRAAGLEPQRLRRRTSQSFPYDGGFLFLNRLEREALAEELGLDVWSEQAEPHRVAAVETLRRLYTSTGWRGGPSPYAAVVVLDGDSMGKRIDRLLERSDSPEAHREFSQKLAHFAHEVRELAGKSSGVELVYNGGDDVLALAPVSQALDFARAAAKAFHEITEGSASAGIAIAHWLQPLGDALKAARRAEERAKQVKDKAAVCLELRRRSGEVTGVRATWAQLDDLGFDRLVELFRTGRLSGRLPYALRESARVFARIRPDFEAVIKRVIARQGDWPEGSGPERDALVGRLAAFARALEKAGLPGADELTGWLVVARFLAGGGEE